MAQSPSPPDSLLFADPFTAPPRRSASFSYNPSAHKERFQKQRPLVIVIPPGFLHEQHGQLGHILSLGPSQRLAQGIVMPLYPTMYAQLTAIAREFNFPSTTGLCLYLYYSENGLTVTPRISDEAWHSLWGSNFDVPPPVGRVMPINGVIEFDIDLRQARWYSAWISSSLRDAPDWPSATYPHTSVSEGHRHGDSRATVYDEYVDDHRDAPMYHPIPSVHSQRQHFPRKLSLVDRTGVFNPRALQSSPSPEKTAALAQVLSPIAQESEPRTARQDLQTRVQSWRDNAILEPTRLASTGHLGLELANMPNAVDIDVPAETTDALRLEDYAWSITSAGPEDRESISSAHSDHPPSVFLEDRLAGSVCATPSVCTSFGHVDYGFDSPADVVYGLPTPDLARRVMKSAPLTPMTATTWGAPTSCPQSPQSVSCAPSVDIGHRLNLSPPLTPLTATSWGHPHSYPPSPPILTAPTTPDIGCRAFEETEWHHSWSFYNSTPESQSLTVQKPSQSSEARSHYPHLNIYPAAYPFFDLYPAFPGTSLSAASAADNSSGRTAVTVTLKEYPSFNLYPPVCPSLDIYPSMLQITLLPNHCESSVSNIAQSYPTFNLYPPVYPFLGIYPSVTKYTYSLTLHTASLSTAGAVSLPLDAQYLNFNLYPSVYPFLNIYPSVIKLDESPTQVKSLSPAIHSHSYPVFDLYPAIYPYFNLYPSVAQINSSPTVDVLPLNSFSFCVYPVLVIYPPVYPYFDLYPSLVQDVDLPKLHVSMPAEPVDVHLKYGYPFIDIYPPAYPHLDIYPGTELLNYHGISLQYPSFELYPMVKLNISPPVKACTRPKYTHFQLYEQVLKERSLELRRKKSHRELHFDVFPSGLIPTPSGITKLLDESCLTPDSGNPTPLLKAGLQASSLSGKHLFQLPVVLPPLSYKAPRI